MKNRTFFIFSELENKYITYKELAKITGCHPNSIHRKLPTDMEPNTNRTLEFKIKGTENTYKVNLTRVF